MGLYANENDNFLINTAQYKNMYRSLNICIVNNLTFSSDFNLKKFLPLFLSKLLCFITCVSFIQCFLGKLEHSVFENIDR